MYLPLAAVVTAVTLGGYLVCWKLACRGLLSQRMAGILGGCTATAAALTLGILTFHRNADYRSDLSIWQDTVDKVPGNAGAHNDLGNALAGRGQVDEAIAHYRKALEIKPDYAEAHNNLGMALAGRGQVDEAIACYRKALEIKPDLAEAHDNLGMALAGRGQVDEAITHYRKALEINPDLAEAHNNLGVILASADSLMRPSPIFSRRWKSILTSPRPTTTSAMLWPGRERSPRRSSNGARRSACSRSRSLL